MLKCDVFFYNGHGNAIKHFDEKRIKEGYEEEREKVRKSDFLEQLKSKELVYKTGIILGCSSLAFE